MALNAGEMSERMDLALDALMRNDGRPGLPSSPEELVQDRKRLFQAIAEGVIAHLRASPDAFVLEVTFTPVLRVRVARID